jgi:hypothetical protein
VQRRQSRGLGLDLADLGRGHPPQTTYAVRATPRLELVQPRQLALLQRYDQLAAALVRDRVLVAELVHEPRALDAESSLQRARSVVDAAVDDSGVVAGLVPGDLGLLVDDRQPQAGAPREQLPGNRESDDAGADHDDVV